MRPARSGGRDAELDADPGRGAQAVGDRLAVEQPAVAGRRLDGMAERMAEVERDPAAGRIPLALVGHDDLDLGPARPLDELGDDARCEDRRIAPRDRRAVGLEQLEQPLVAEGRHLDRLAEGGPQLALGERPQERRRR